MCVGVLDVRVTFLPDKIVLRVGQWVVDSQSVIWVRAAESSFIIMSVKNTWFAESRPTEEMFVFEKWAKTTGLTKTTVNMLKEQDLATKQSLTLLEVEDVKSLSLSLGQEKVLSASISNISCWCRASLRKPENKFCTSYRRQRLLPWLMYVVRRPH